MPTYRIAALGLGLALTLAACSSGGSPRLPRARLRAQQRPAQPLELGGFEAASASPSATTVAAVSSSPLNAPSAEITAVVLTAKDLSKGYAVKLESGGAKVAGQVTLDNCGYPFTTEAHRVARRQVMVMSPAGQETGLENEVVAYDSEAQAKLALAQWRLSMKSCHVGVAWTPRDPGTPKLTYTHFAHQKLSGMPVPDNDLATFTAKAQGQTVHLTVVFQRSGRRARRHLPDEPHETELARAERRSESSRASPGSASPPSDLGARSRAPRCTQRLTGSQIRDGRYVCRRRRTPAAVTRARPRARASRRARCRVLERLPPG